MANDRGEEAEDSPKLDLAEAALYRRMVGILLHVVMDRGDLCFAVRLTAQHLREPTTQSMDRLRRVIKYAYGTRHDELKLEWAEFIRDSDWAWNKTTYKSATYAWRFSPGAEQYELRAVAIWRCTINAAARTTSKWGGSPEEKTFYTFFAFFYVFCIVLHFFHFLRFFIFYFCINIQYIYLYSNIELRYA